MELSRGHHKKKKKIKAIKKAIIKLVLIALLIKSKLKMLLTAFQTFLQFKAVLLATILVLIHAAKLWVEIKHKHHPQKVSILFKYILIKHITKYQLVSTSLLIII